MIAGSISLLYPLGWLADRLPRRLVTSGCAAAAGLLAALLPLGADEHLARWPIVFCWGGAFYGVYVLALVALGDRFTGVALVTGNAAFGVMWGIGGMLGPLLTGAAMSALGPAGFPVTLASLFLILALALARPGPSI